MRAQKWDIKEGFVRLFNARGEVAIWLDPEQAERLGRDLRQKVPNARPPCYVPRPSCSNHGEIERMR